MNQYGLVLNPPWMQAVRAVTVMPLKSSSGYETKKGGNAGKPLVPTSGAGGFVYQV